MSVKYRDPRCRLILVEWARQIHSPQSEVKWLRKHRVSWLLVFLLPARIKTHQLKHVNCHLATGSRILGTTRKRWVRRENSKESPVLHLQFGSVMWIQHGGWQLPSCVNPSPEFFKFKFASFSEAEHGYASSLPIPSDYQFTTKNTRLTKNNKKPQGNR